MKDEGGRSETITLLRLYSPNRLLRTELKYYESNGSKDIGTVILDTQELKARADITPVRWTR